MSRHPPGEGPPRGSALLALVPALTTLATSTPAIVLQDLGRDLHARGGVTAWVLVLYNLALGVCTPLAGRLSDRYGARRVMASGSALLTIGSVAAITAASFGVLLSARIVQGIGVAAIASAAFATIGASPRTRARAWTMGLLTAGASLAFGAGPLIGGATAAIAGWRATFALPLIGAGVGAFVARRVGPAPDPQGSIDWAGAALLAFVAACVLTAIQARETHLSAAAALALVVGAGLGALLLARHNRRRSGGFLAASYLRAGDTRREVVSAATLGTANLAMAFLAPLLISRSHPGWSPLHIGAVLFPGAAIPIATAFLTRSMSRGPGAVRALIALGAVAAIGMVVAGLEPGVVAIAFATGTATAGFAGAQVILFSRIPGLIEPREVGLTLGLVSLFSVLGGAVGAATAGAFVDLFDTRWATVAAAALPALTIVVLGRVGGRQRVALRG